MCKAEFSSCKRCQHVSCQWLSVCGNTYPLPKILHLSESAIQTITSNNEVPINILTVGDLKFLKVYPLLDTKMVGVTETCVNCDSAAHQINVHQINACPICSIFKMGLYPIDGSVQTDVMLVPTENKGVMNGRNGHVTKRVTMDLRKVPFIYNGDKLCWGCQ